jgi:hypothetical protein
MCVESLVVYRQYVCGGEGNSRTDCRMRIAISPLFAIRSFWMGRCGGLVVVMLELVVVWYKALV